jgi:hypothetical protein
MVLFEDALDPNQTFANENHVANSCLHFRQGRCCIWGEYFLSGTLAIYLTLSSFCLLSHGIAHLPWNGLGMWRGYRGRGPLGFASETSLLTATFPERNDTGLFLWWANLFALLQH